MCLFTLSSKLFLPMYIVSHIPSRSLRGKIGILQSIIIRTYPCTRRPYLMAYASFMSDMDLECAIAIFTKSFI